MLGRSAEPLSRAYDLAMLDLDGVVYIGPDAVPGAPEHLARARAAGMRLAYITNNASRPPSEVVAQLRELGVDAEVDDVVTSAQAAAHVLLERYGAGARVVCLGAAGLREALEAAGLIPVGAEDDAAAVATGYGPDVVWSDLMRVAVRVREGLPWVASNADATFPAPFGQAPGHGVQVDMLRRFTGVEPVVAGKPERPLLDETVRRLRGRRPLMVGDRLDTDIEGGRRAGVDTLLVLTGVTGLRELVEAVPEQRPTYVSLDLAGLGESHEAPRREGSRHGLDGWWAQVDRGALVVSGRGPVGSWWRVVASAAWTHADDTGAAPDLGELRPPAAG